MHAFVALHSNGLSCLWNVDVSYVRDLSTESFRLLKFSMDEKSLLRLQRRHQLNEFRLISVARKLDLFHFCVNRDLVSIIDKFAFFFGDLQWAFWRKIAGIYDNRVVFFICPFI